MDRKFKQTWILIGVFRAKCTIFIKLEINVLKKGEIEEAGS